MEIKWSKCSRSLYIGFVLYLYIIHTQPRDEPDGCDGPVLAPSPTSQKYLSPKKSVEPDIYVDTKTPYISRLIEQKSGKFHRNSNSMKNIEVRTPPTEVRQYEKCSIIFLHSNHKIFKVLSEFHTTRREYIEYRNSRKFPVNNSGLSAHSLGHQHQQVSEFLCERFRHNY